jgi:hypothetical protein
MKISGELANKASSNMSKKKLKCNLIYINYSSDQFNINQTDDKNSGFTALHYAAHGGKQ